MKAMSGWRGSDPTNMLIIPTETVIKVAATSETTVFVTACGRLYIGNYNGKDKGSLKLIDVGSKCILDAALYKGLIIFVTDKGIVYSMDSENYISTQINILEPKKTCSHGKEEYGKKVFVEQLSAGLDHILFLSSKNEIWVLGKGPALGLFTNKTENEIKNPTRVDFFKGRKVLQTVAGHYFTMALVEALPPFQCSFGTVNEHIADLDSYVRSCSLCRKETGDRVLFEDNEDLLKCPLGLGVCCDTKRDFLSPTPSSVCQDRRLSQNSNAFEENESSDYLVEDFDFTSGDTSCDGTTLNTPVESKSGMEMKSICKLRKQSTDSFEVVENDLVKLNIEYNGEKSNSTGTLSMTKDAARQFFSRPLSWVTSTNIDSESYGLDSERFSYKYPIDSATELIKENVASAASLVATSVRTVGDKVGQLSRHFSSTDCVEGTEDISLNGDSLKYEISIKRPISNLNKSESYDWNSFPRLVSGSPIKKTHIRTGSMGLYHSRAHNEGLLATEKNFDQVETAKRGLEKFGKSLLNSEIYGWGSSSKGQLGLGDLTHRTTPTNIVSLNHFGVTKIVCGSHHTAALTVEGHVYVWGNPCSNRGSAVPLPELLILPSNIAVRDVASGDDFLVLVSLDGHVFYVSMKDLGDSSKVKEIPIPESSSFFHSALCQAQSIVCTTEEINPKILSFLQSEATYLSLLKKTVNHIVLPFINITTNGNNNHNKHSLSSGSLTLSVHEQVQATKQNLLETYLSLSYISICTFHNAKESEATDVTLVLPIIHQVEELISIYKEYITMVCDALAVSGLNLESKEADIILEKSKVHFEGPIFETIKNHTDLFYHLLLLPLKRIEEYEKFLLEIRNNRETFYSPFSLDKIKVAYTHWKQLSVLACNNKIDAEHTRLFWSSCSPRLFESLATPKRRLLRDSKKTPINLLNAGRFSSHSFILMTDILIHNTYNNFVTYNLCSMWVEALLNLSNNQNLIQITLPEETLTLVCPSPVDKGQWLQSLQDGIKNSLQSPNETLYTLSRSPPLVRNAIHTFLKHPQYKEATYSGQWFCGKIHGEGSLTWPDGKRYIGQFRHNVYQGFGRLEVPCGSGVNIFEGCWKKGKLEGRGVIRYANKDVYVGFLRESQPHGHGELKKGRFSSEAASVYTGEWCNGVKHGYGVLDEIAQGEKYHGMWLSNNRHGPGMVVTLNDVYYEGNFYQNKLTGYGLMIIEDGTSYEGELGPGGTCNGKGTLKYTNGDYIEGTFSGSWQEGIKINGTLFKGNSFHNDLSILLPMSFGKFSVPAIQKWTSLFKHCEEQLGIVSGVCIDTPKVWENLASFIEGEKQTILRAKGNLQPIDGLDKIPEVAEELSFECIKMMQDYLEMAFASCLHPLGQLMHSLVDAFRATYGGVVAHPRLLQYAVQEIWSFSSRLYRLVRYLFPGLPPEGDNFILEMTGSFNDDVVVTEAFVIHPWLLPHLYATLSPLYVRHHQKRDEEYWQRLLKWNKQSDIALMTFLGVDMKFWLFKGENLVENGDALSAVDKHFLEALETLQLLSTSFTPKDKLLLIRKCGILINQEVTSKLGNTFVLSMDDLLPIFLYVVVRARIQHLGAELGLIEDLIDPLLQNGELDHVFTTLKACYFHILHEKPSPGMYSM